MHANVVTLHQQQAVVQILRAPARFASLDQKLGRIFLGFVSLHGVQVGEVLGSIQNLR